MPILLLLPALVVGILGLWVVLLLGYALAYAWALRSRLDRQRGSLA